MQTPPTHEEPEEKPLIYGTHLGDLGVVVIAAIVTLAIILLLFMPSPFAGMEKAQAEAAKIAQKKAEAQRRKAIDEAVASGEVSVGIGAAKKH